VTQLSKVRLTDRPAGPAGASGSSNEPGSRLIPVLLLLLFTIMTVPPGFDYTPRPPGSVPNDGDAFSFTTWVLLLLGSGYLVVRNRQKARELLAAVNRPFLYFVLLATLSLLWSIEPAITLRRLERLYIIVLVSLAFAAVGWQPRRFETYLRWLLALLLGASAIFCYWNPLLAIHQQHAAELQNAWHGITTGKNILGTLAGCAFILWLHGFLTRETGRLIAVANMFLAGLCLLMSRSSTSLMSTVFASFFVVLLVRPPSFMRRRMPYFVGLFAAAVLIYALAVLNIVPGMSALLTPISSITGKDLTFSGRTNIWYVLRLHMRAHPLLGTGYEAYWIGPVPSSPSYDMIKWLWFYPTEGHNGYLDVMNDLGYVGGICLLAYFIRYLRQGLELMRLEKFRGAIYLALMFRAFLADMSESHWFSVTSIDFVIFTLATFSLARELLWRREGSPGHLPIEVPQNGSRAQPNVGSPIPASGLRSGFRSSSGSPRGRLPRPQPP
jgi:exopolysaccharide production protein ExoQ